jgi:phosphohistidine swiveling domain-containing protein
MHSISKKLLSGVIAAGMIVTTATSFAATNIGTGTVQGSGALTSSVVWNDTFTSGSATGTINGLQVRARVLPVLNMVVSGSGIIDLGNLSSAAASTGSVNVEIGTNAVNGASVTARSTNGGLQNTSNASVYINDLTADEVSDSYKYLSAIIAADDSSYAAFAQTATLNTEVDNNTTNHIIYSSNKPQQLSGTVDDFSFSVAAQPNIETPAGDYTDVVVMTVTGNF